MLQTSPSRRPVQDRINIGTGSVSPSFASPAFQSDQLPAASHAQARIPIVAANHLAQLQLHDRLLTPPVGRSHVQDRIPMRPGTLMRTVAVRRDHVPSHYAMLGTPQRPRTPDEQTGSQAGLVLLLTRLSLALDRRRAGVHRGGAPQAASAPLTAVPSRRGAAQRRRAGGGRAEP